MLPFLLPALPALLNLAVQHAPSIIGVLAGDSAGKTVEKVVNVAKEVLGTTDPKEAEEKMAADPKLAEMFAARLNAETEQLKAELADVANARAMGVALVDKRHWTANMPAILVLLIVIGFFFFFSILFFIRIELPERMFQLLMFGFGTISSAFGGAIQYYLGTTRQNAQKDEQNTALTAALMQSGSNVVPLRKAA